MLEIFKNFKIDKNSPAKKVTKIYNNTYAFTHRIKFAVEVYSGSMPAGFSVDAMLTHQSFGTLETKSHITVLSTSVGSMLYFDIDFSNVDLCKDIAIIFTFPSHVDDYYVTLLANFLNFNENREPFMVRREL